MSSHRDESYQPGTKCRVSRSAGVPPASDMVGERFAPSLISFTSHDLVGGTPTLLDAGIYTNPEAGLL